MGTSIFGSRRAKASIGLLISFGFIALPVVALCDPCREAIPTRLQMLISTTFPNERLPQSSDSTEDNRVEALKSGNSCLLETWADLRGDGRKDLVLALPSKNSSRFRIVVAMAKSKGWRLTSVAVEDGDIATQELYRAPPGLYVHTKAFDFVPKDGALERFEARRDGFYIGAVEGAADAYFFDQGRWVHVHSVD